MNRLGFGLAGAVGVLMAASLSAQTLTPRNAKHVIARGCVTHSNTQAPVGGAADESNPDTKFVLTIPVVGTTASVSGTDPTASNVRYRLDDADQLRVAPHVGHKVEIKGTVETSASQRKATDPPNPIAPIVRVESIKEISSTCVP